jgi:cysteine sulfinate desulfinase/cysteine desulfurase-like protein
MGVSEDVAGSVIRVSFGPATSEADIARFLTEWRRVLNHAKAKAA